VAASGVELPPHLWGQAGNALQAQGRTGEAVDAWMRAFEGDPSEWETGDALRKHAPALLWAHVERLASTTRDDEVLGDLADLNWRDGRTEQALELWRRARSLDPGDSEWSNKLRAVALGKEPL
jgi:Flp pilus assembly protein TadD